MKAVIIRGYGGPDVIELADVPVPQPGRGQVRIRVRAAPVHPVDIATRAGRLAEHGLMAASGDVGLGWDLAGVVDALGRLGAGEFVARTQDLGAAVRRVVPAGVHGALDAGLAGMPALDAVRDKAHSWRSRPVPRLSRCAARACITSGSTPTGRGWPSSPLSSTLAS
jgi:NADPH:quinone reductase-like Zn-dependent oxidoreductase